ncbi:MAG: methyltransferase domain-containing protein, partial [Candidatus Aenigmarchaeota archaeon]|nr:methyltransferase domain-containing protein [Candidatus Aenigmarchaeota archaeon]
MKRKINIRKAWNKMSKSYQNAHKIPTKHAHYGPGVSDEDKLKLLGNVKGKKILEIGCGGGQCSIAFAKQGAKVIGIDISEEQLKFAKNLAKKEKVKIKFIRSNIENLKQIKSKSQDIVFSAFALQYVKNLKKCLKEVFRVLKNKGIFVFSLDHPFFDILDNEKLEI